MPTAYIAPTTAANTAGAEITIAAGTPQTFGLYTAAGGAVPSIDATTPFVVQRKNPSLTFDDTGLVLTSANPQVRLDSPGIYKILKPATSVAIGINQD